MRLGAAPLDAGRRVLHRLMKRHRWDREPRQKVAFYGSNKTIEVTDSLPAMGGGAMRRLVACDRSINKCEAANKLADPRIPVGTAGCIA